MDNLVELTMTELLVSLVVVASIGFCWGMLAGMWPEKRKKNSSESSERA